MVYYQVLTNDNLLLSFCANILNKRLRKIRTNVCVACANVCVAYKLLLMTVPALPLAIILHHFYN